MLSYTSTHNHLVARRPRPI